MAKNTLMKKPALIVWLLFGGGIISFMISTLNPIPDTEINTINLIGQGFFATGILLGAYLVIKSKRK